MVIAEMKRRGIQPNSHQAMVQAVDSFAEESDHHHPWLREMFGVARTYHQNFYNKTNA